MHVERFSHENKRMFNGTQNVCIAHVSVKALEMHTVHDKGVFRFIF